MIDVEELRQFGPIQQKDIYYRGNRVATYKIGTGKKVIFALPGLPHSGLIYLWLLRAYGFDKCQIITLDFPGWVGDSEKHITYDLNFEATLELLENILAEYGVVEYSILGHSFGGIVAAKLAAHSQRKVNNLALISTVANPEVTRGDSLDRQFRWIVAIRSPIFLKLYFYFRYVRNKFRMKSTHDQQADSALKIYDKMFRNVDARIVINMLSEFIDTHNEMELKKIKSMGIDVIVACATKEDSLFRKQCKYIADLLDTKLYEFEGAHHSLILNPANEPTKIVFDFLLA